MVNQDQNRTQRAVRGIFKKILRQSSVPRHTGWTSLLYNKRSYIQVMSYGQGQKRNDEMINRNKLRITPYIIQM